MGDLIPEIKWADLVKIVEDGKIGQLKACEVLLNGGYTFTAVIPHGDMVTRDYTKTQAEYLSLRANITGGVDPDEILNVISPDNYPNLVKARAARQAKILEKEKENANIPVPM